MYLYVARAHVAMTYLVVTIDWTQSVTASVLKLKIKPMGISGAVIYQRNNFNKKQSMSDVNHV